jgi:hypothetical protein
MVWLASPKASHKPEQNLSKLQGFAAAPAISAEISVNSFDTLTPPVP